MVPTSCLLLMLLASTILDVEGGITVPPGGKDLYLKSGDRLVLECDQYVQLGADGKPLRIVWSKASTSKVALTRTGSGSESQPQPPDHDLRYITIDTTGAYGGMAPYTITKKDDIPKSGASADAKVISELIKEDVRPADSGYYRCRLGLSGVSSRVLVTVLDMVTQNAQLERIFNDTQLECLVTDQDGSTNYSVTWYKHGEGGNDVDVMATGRQLSSGRAKYVTSRRRDGTSVLTVRRTADGDAGIYSCRVTCGVGDTVSVLSQQVQLYASPHVRSFHTSRTVVKGHSLELECHAWGWPLPRVTWYRDQTELNSTMDSRVALSDVMDVSNARLTINDFGSSPGDRNRYTCVATSLTGDDTIDNATVLVRVKDRMAALWPLLGIAAEALILLVIITVHEMRRNTAATAEAEADASHDIELNATKTSTTGNSHHHDNNSPVSDGHVVRRKNN